MKFHSHYCSFIPVLIKTVLATNGDVLEMGTGIYSTPLLHWMCSPHGRNLVSYENSEKSLLVFGTRSFEDEFHKVFLVEDWDSIDIQKDWDVVLIDHAPAERRKVDAIKVADHAKYVILHDSDGRLNKHYGYNEVYPHFRYRFDFCYQRPYTTVLSNLVDLRDFSP